MGLQPARLNDSLMRLTATLVAALGLVVAPLADAQRSTNVPRIGYMSPGDVPRFDNAFLQGLERQGFISAAEIPRYDDASWRALLKRGFFQGQNIRIEIRATAERFPSHAPEMAAELVQLNVDLLYAATLPEAMAAQQAVQRAGKATPIVFGPLDDPVGAGLIVSLAQPGRNITGLGLSAPEFLGKQLEVLKETFPAISRVAYLHESAYYSPAQNLRAKQAVRAAAEAKSIGLEILELEAFADIDAALSRVAAGRADAILVMGGPISTPVRRRIVDFAARRRLPAMYGDSLFVEAGGLMFYGTPYADWCAQAAVVVAKILRGNRPKDIPVEQPTRFRLLINLKTARTLGVTIPQSILLSSESVDTLEP